MKILFIINQLGGGGAERVLTLIANNMVRENEVYILSFSPGVSKYYIDKKILVKEIKLQKKTVLNVVKEIRKEIKRIKPDCFISFEYHMNMKAILGSVGIKGVKKVISERNDPASKGGKTGIKQIRDILYRFVDVLVCQTPDAKAYFPKTIQKKTVIIPNPVIDSLPNPWEGEREKKVVNFCRLESQKNIPLLIDAFEIFHRLHMDYVLEIYGDGSEHDFIDRYIENKGLKNSVFLFPATMEIHSKILKAKMFVSSSNYEGLSNSMIEALALGIPTICTDCPCGGAKMLITNGENGYLTKVGDAGEMSRLMNMIADNEDISQRFSRRSTKIKEVLSSESIIQKWNSILK